MAKSLSVDLRSRVIRAVEEEGLSRRAASARFGVGVSSAIRWVAEKRRSGRTEPLPQGGDRRSDRIEAQADFILARVKETPDITLEELRETLIAERGETFGTSTLHDFFRRRGISYKKRPPTPPNRTAQT